MLKGKHTINPEIEKYYDIKIKNENVIKIGKMIENKIGLKDMRHKMSVIGVYIILSYSIILNYAHFNLYRRQKMVKKFLIMKQQQ